MKVTSRNLHWNKLLLAVLFTAVITIISVGHYHTQYRRQALLASSLHDEKDDTGYSAAERLVMEGIRTGACDNWQPPTIDDTPGRSECWKDKWFQQLGGVLDNWEEYSTLSFAKELNQNNHDNLQRLLFCLPHYTLPMSPEAPEECQHLNALTVMLSAHWWTDMARGTGLQPSGEVIHLRPIMQALDRNHYTILTIYHKDYAGLVKLYSALPDVISTIWAEDRLVVSCMADPRCRSDFPQEEKDRMGLSDVKGHIPSWKMVTLTYWALRSTSSWEWGQREGDGFTFNTLSHDWIVSPYAYPGHHHIPFSLEDTCSSIPIVPESERKNQAVVLGKLITYFHPERMWGLPPPTETWLDFEERTGLSLVANARSEGSEDLALPAGINNHGPVPFDNYTSEVGHSRMMIALGFPVISPSPYLALCQGVPVLLPYSGDTPTPAGFDLYEGSLTQHGPAALLGEPYVYSYNRHDMDTFWTAVEKAKNNPIEPYIPDEMRLTNVYRLTLQLINRDARALAQGIQEARRAQGEPVDALVPDYVLRAVQKNGWLTRLRANGTVSKELSDDGLGYR